MCASLGVILRERPDARTQLRSNTQCAVEAALLDPRTGATGTIVAPAGAEGGGGGGGAVPGAEERVATVQ